MYFARLEIMAGCFRTRAAAPSSSFELNKKIVHACLKHDGFDFALSMIKLRGFGGKTEFWDHNLETFTLMAGARCGDQ